MLIFLCKSTCREEIKKTMNNLPLEAFLKIKKKNILVEYISSKIIILKDETIKLSKIIQ